jgi:prepilin-type N-terminal cleavage/methylation domain-containing protein
MISLHRLPRAAQRAGFTLIELMAVILIIGLLMTFLLPKIPEMIDQAKVTGCAKNQADIHQGLLMYQSKFKKLPAKENTGVRFFAILIASKTWEDTEASAKKLTCPGVDLSAVGPAEVPMEEWYTDLELMDGGYSAYAGRDTMSFPLRKLTGKQPLVACDNDPEMNHRTATNVLYGNGDVKAIEIFTLQQEGILTEDEEYLMVGPESPIEDLQKLSLE